MPSESIDLIAESAFGPPAFSFAGGPKTLLLGPYRNVEAGLLVFVLDMAAPLAVQILDGFGQNLFHKLRLDHAVLYAAALVESGERQIERGPVKMARRGRGVYIAASLQVAHIFFRARQARYDRTEAFEFVFFQRIAEPAPDVFEQLLGFWHQIRYGVRERFDFVQPTAFHAAQTRMSGLGPVFNRLDTYAAGRHQLLGIQVVENSRISVLERRHRGFGPENHLPIGLNCRHAHRNCDNRNECGRYQANVPFHFLFESSFSHRCSGICSMQINE